MPGTLGARELARQAQLRLPALAMLFTSGYTDNAIVHRGRLDDGVELLSKPYTQEELARKLRKVLAVAPAVAPVQRVSDCDPMKQRSGPGVATVDGRISTDEHAERPGPYLTGYQIVGASNEANPGVSTRLLCSPDRYFACGDMNVVGLPQQACQSRGLDPRNTTPLVRNGAA